ncbi:MAG: hypothetical protein Athens071416_520 [Parcubacteria group bacterium Athens0714_16]|nr:MAG: hypothetical protein Athens071416_520 [Parcubacteria group bacterium Athens0714_16]
MGVNQKIVLSFKNARNVRLPKSVAKELEGIELETWPGYPQGEIIIVLSQLLSQDSSGVVGKEDSVLIVKYELTKKLSEKGSIFSRDWIEANIPGRFIRITKDCIKQ